ncbi:hypothetical protein CRYPA_1415 [uncultured Candidatus Thioglobus sp.]|nr:hypothetical protein CRYPA_1415 [uncultured Candidatus Thioglobus sp.]
MKIGEYAVKICNTTAVKERVELIANNVRNIDGKAHLVIIEMIHSIARVNGDFSDSEELLIETFVDLLDVTQSEVFEMIKRRN